MISANKKPLRIALLRSLKIHSVQNKLKHLYNNGITCIVQVKIEAK